MILVVDDSHDSATALSRIFTKLGYESKTAHNGEEALACIRAHPREQPLLVILDHMMPGICGVDTLRAIRMDPKISTTPVMFFTAGFDVERREEAMTLGALAWLYKGGTASMDLDAVIKEMVRIYENVGGAKRGNACST